MRSDPRLGFLVALLLVGCDDSASDGEADAGPPDAGPPSALWVDTDRDGVLSATDEVGVDSWTAEHGAVFLANLDDDDEDGDPDAEDNLVNGDDDARDLARVQVTAWPEAPDMAQGTIEINGDDRVRWFRDNGSHWAHVEGASVALNVTDLRSGAAFGIEGLSLLEDDGWDGRITVTLLVQDGSVDDSGAPAGPMVTTAVLRQAPVVVSYNTAPTHRVFASDTTASSGAPLLLTLDDLARDVDVESHVINAVDPDYLIGGIYPDQWTQDFFEIGAMYLPVPEGVNRMGVGIRLKPVSEAGTFVEKELFGPDFATLYPFDDNTYDANSDGQSLDYGGNLEVVPPHEGYPVGRLIVGSTPTRYPDATYFGNLGAQYAQAPVLEMDSSWLLVGHVDEVLSFVADPSSARGWKAVIHAPGEAWQMLLDLVADDPANADLLVFQGKVSETTVGEILANADYASAQDIAQAYADELRQLLKDEVGLTDDDFVELPFLWEALPFGPGGSLRYFAYSPGVVNMLTFEGQALVADPFGPEVGNVDVLADVTRQRLEALGLTVTFVNIWDLYHQNLGEVHCGTNVDRALPEGAAWWEMSR